MTGQLQRNRSVSKDTERIKAMNTMYDAVMKMEQLLGVYERLIDDLAGYMKENGIDYTNDDSVHPAIMLYSEAGRIYSRLLRTRKMEDLLRMEGEYNLMNGMVNEMKAGAWANLSGEDVSRKVM